MLYTGTMSVLLICMIPIWLSAGHWGIPDGSMFFASSPEVHIDGVAVGLPMNPGGTCATTLLSDSPVALLLTWVLPRAMRDPVTRRVSVDISAGAVPAWTTESPEESNIPTSRLLIANGMSLPTAIAIGRT